MHTATISKHFDFSASHRLDGLPETHPCSRWHGHNYDITITLTGKTDDVGFVLDYRALDFVKDYIKRVLDHRTLNKQLPNINPTAENIGLHFLDMVIEHLREHHDDVVQRLTDVTVGVSETPKTWAHVSARAPYDLPVSVEEVDRDRYRWGHR